VYKLTSTRQGLLLFGMLLDHAACAVCAALLLLQVIKSTIERYWWDRIRNPETIRSLLQLVYARPSTIDDALLERIVEVSLQAQQPHVTATATCGTITIHVHNTCCNALL
jgi:hypothetical protein